MSANPEDVNFFEGLEFNVECALSHRTLNIQKPVPCQKPALWIGTIHFCSKAEGLTTVFCQDFLDMRINMKYPQECVGCSKEFADFTQVIWDYHRL